MTNSDSFFDDPPEPHKLIEPTDGYNRYLLPEEDGTTGRGWTQPSTLAGDLGTAYGLTKWQMERVAWAFGQRPELVATAASCATPDNPEDRAVLKEVVQKALLVGKAEEASTLGTALHAVLMRVDKGETLDTIPEFFHADIKAYWAELVSYGINIVPEWVERVVKNDLYRLGGRYDNIVEMGGEYYILDKKRTDDPRERPHKVATQLAPYAHADAMMNYETGKYDPMPRVNRDWALVAWFAPGSGTCEIMKINIYLGWWSVRIAMETREWRNTKSLVHPLVRKDGVLSQTEPIVVYDTQGGSGFDYITDVGIKNVYARSEEELVHMGVAPPADQAELPQYTETDNFFARPEPDEESVTPPMAYSAQISEKLSSVAQAAGNTPAPPTLQVAVPMGGVTELMKLTKKELQQICTALGITDINHHRRPLAEAIVTARNAGKTAQTNGQAPSAPTVDLSQEAVINRIWLARSNDELTSIYTEWTGAYGSDSWKGDVLSAAIQQSQKIFQMQQPQTTNPLG